MSIANNNNAPDAVALFCATCGSSDVTSSPLAGGEGACNTCGWKGRADEFAVLPFHHGMGSPEAVFQALFRDIRGLFSLKEFAMAFGGMLIKWGFMETPTPKNILATRKHLATYVAATAQAVAIGIIKARTQLEKERNEQRPSA